VATLDDIPTPALLVDKDRLLANVRSMQGSCAARGVELRPHAKTHKMSAVVAMQLAAGAAGITCAKLGEAEALLPSGVRRVFVAHSLVDPGQAPRVAALAGRLEELRAAVTCPDQADALDRLAAAAGLRLQVMLAVDTGLGREGARSPAEAAALAARVARSRHLELRGLYTHEGQLYSVPPAGQAAACELALSRLCAARDAVDRALPVWPGSSVGARHMAASGRVQAVRPGAYVFGDLFLSRVCAVMEPAEVALTVLATVVDRPEPGLALIDAGSKTLSGDRTPDGIHATCASGRDLAVVRVNEEHGYVRGGAAGSLRVGERIRLVPAHVCPVVNLADWVEVLEDGRVSGRWPVDARGKTN
jgi:D-serine deaminase-like pyridoxal phosphate-dependent protein